MIDYIVRGHGSSYGNFGLTYNLTSAIIKYIIKAGRETVIISEARRRDIRFPLFTAGSADAKGQYFKFHVCI